MNETENRISVGTPLPTVSTIEPMGELSLRVTWGDGHTDIVDLSSLIQTFKVFLPLRQNRLLFTQVSVGYLGASVTWGGDMDIGADTLKRLAELQRPMPPTAFKGFMERHRMTLDSASAALGISRRQVAYFSTGEKPIPRTVALACRGYDAAVEH